MVSLPPTLTYGNELINYNRNTRPIQDLILVRKKSLNISLKRLKSCAKANKKLREKKKKALKIAIQDFPSLNNSIRVRDSTGKPPLEETYSNLHQDILKIATIGSAASDRRRADLIRTVKTLDDLHKALEDMNYKISRSALYLRILPKSASTQEGKRHVRTVPVRYFIVLYCIYCTLLYVL